MALNEIRSTSQQATLARGALLRVAQIASQASPEVRAQSLDRIRSLPILLRRQGLLAVMGQLHNGADPADELVAEHLLDTLAAVMPFNGTARLARIEELASAPLQMYLMSSRLALQAAEAWVRMAEAVLEPEVPAQVGADRGPGGGPDARQDATHPTGTGAERAGGAAPTSA